MGERNQHAGTKRLLSGIRPSGALHLGQYVGALKQWLDYQRDYECYFILADVQALTTHLDRPEVIQESIREVTLDWLAVGLDPKKSCFLVQSQIPELTELTVYLQLLVQTGELKRNPTVREEARWFGKGDLHEHVDEVSFGFLGYPISQVADILLFTTTPPHAGDSLIVPVGEDQLPHIEFARQVARRFNGLFGDVFLEPAAKTSPLPSLPGTDGGSKMGKSRRNTILLKESVESYTEKIHAMFTDPLRMEKGDPGHPDGCPCFIFHQAFGWDETEASHRYEDCLLARTDCDSCKTELVGAVKTFLDPIQERRAKLVKEPDLVRDILTDGTKRARAVAE
ncbi:MAG: tryptophan--tRNA ligase, partial [Planctomycetota bacterium]